jgi:hypothetical protein
VGRFPGNAFGAPSHSTDVRPAPSAICHQSPLIRAPQTPKGGANRRLYESGTLFTLVNQELPLSTYCG